MSTERRAREAAEKKRRDAEAWAPKLAALEAAGQLEPVVKLSGWRRVSLDAPSRRGGTFDLLERAQLEPAAPRRVKSPYTAKQRARRRKTLNRRRAEARARLGRSFRRKEYDGQRESNAEKRAAVLAEAPQCELCGGILAVPKTGKVPKLCSNKCRQAAWYLAKAKEQEEAGVCGCGQPRAPGHTRCAACHDRSLGRSRASKAKARGRNKTEGNHVGAAE